MPTSTAGSGATMESVDTSPEAARGIERARWGSLAHLVAAVVLVGLHLSLVFLAFTHSPVDVDEGFNLSVVANVANGVGYTSDGVYTATDPHSFEATIPTGPTVLAPAAALAALGVDVVTAGRIVGVVAYVFLVVGLFVFGRRVAGRWAGLAAASGPLLLDTFTNDNSPLYGPGDLLGEYCAAAFMVWALVLVGRRAVVAFLLLGFAILTKIIAVFAIPGLVIALLIYRIRTSTPISVRTWLGAAFALLVPAAAFEAVKLVAVGPAAYGAVVQDFWDRLGRTRLPTHMVSEKLVSLFGAWFVPGVIALAVVVGAVALVASASWIRLREGGGPRAILSTFSRDPMALSVGAVGVGLGVVAVWLWLRFTDPTWIRHPAPGVVVGAAGAIAAIVWACRWFVTRPDRVRRMTGLVGSALLTILIASASLVHVADAAAPRRLGTLGDQRSIAAVIDATGTQSVQGVWGPMVPLAVMAKTPARSILQGVDPQALLVIDVYPRARHEELGHTLADALCGGVVLDSTVILCWPAPDAQARLDALVPSLRPGDLGSIG